VDPIGEALGPCDTGWGEERNLRQPRVALGAYNCVYVVPWKGGLILPAGGGGRFRLLNLVEQKDRSARKEIKAGH